MLYFKSIHVQILDSNHAANGPTSWNCPGGAFHRWSASEEYRRVWLGTAVYIFHCKFSFSCLFTPFLEFGTCNVALIYIVWKKVTERPIRLRIYQQWDYSCAGKPCEHSCGRADLRHAIHRNGSHQPASLAMYRYAKECTQFWMPCWKGKGFARPMQAPKELMDMDTRVRYSTSRFPSSLFEHGTTYASPFVLLSLLCLFWKTL